MNDSFRRVMISLILPFVFIVGFPIVAFLLDDINTIPYLDQAPADFLATIFGVILVAVGLLLISKTIPLFLKQSEGTNMPWDPIPELIVEGVYRYVRNPMHTGVFAVMLGEGLLLRSRSILIFAIFAILLHLFYIPFSEEKGLEERFGEDYLVYRENVPRWIPRLSPWEPEDQQTDA